MKTLLAGFLLLSVSAFANIENQIVSLKEENCLPVLDSQEFCGEVDGIAVNLMVLGESTYLLLNDGKAGHTYELFANNPIFGGSGFVEETAVDFTLKNGSAIGLIYRGNGNSGKGRLVAVGLNRKQGKACELGVFKSNAKARKAILQGKCL